MAKFHLFPLAALALCQGVLAQQPPTGGALQIPSAPAVPRSAPEIRIEPRSTPAAPDAAQARIAVNVLRVQGATAFAEPELLAVAQFTPGAELSLADLQRMAARITEYYRRHGFFVAQAFLPAQEIRDGAVTLQVSEGRLGRVQVRNDSRVPDAAVHSALAGLESGDPITTDAFESRLLLLSDLPGVSVRSTLVPGASTGTSDLMVDVAPGPAVNGSIDADNGGNRYTGVYRLGATLNVNNPLGLGDLASLRLLTSGSGLQYGRISYQVQAGRGQVGVAYSYLHYELGREFASLGAHGTAQIASVFGRYPLLRTRNDNFYVQLAFDAKQFHDRLDAIPSETDRNSRVLMASVFGDHRDNLWGGGVGSYFATWSMGRLHIETPAALAQDQLTARTEGSFQKLAFSAMRLQRLGASAFSVYGGLSGQLASKNLDVSEKMSAGGMNAVRAYPEGEAYADEGYLATVELRMDLPAPPPPVPGRMQLVVFADTSTVRLNRDPWLSGDNRRTFSGAGVGINWAAPGNFLVRASYARKLGNELATSAPDKSGRFWLQVIKYF